MRDHIKNHPEEAAAIMVAVQSGEFTQKVKDAMTDMLPDYKKLEKIGEEDKLCMLSTWMPMMTPHMWSKVKLAKYGIAKDEKVIHKCWYLMCLETSEAPLPSKSKALLLEIFDLKRDMLEVKPMIAFAKDFTVKWEDCGVYRLCDIVQIDSLQVYSGLKHRFTDLKV